MLNDATLALWFLLPAALANTAPIFCKVIPGIKKWDASVDGGRTFRGRVLFGPHKTWRGLVSGIVVATVVLFLQQLAYEHYGWAQNIAGDIDYMMLPVLLLGPLFGFGAIGGDMIESFFKRQRGIPSGEHWIPFDQLDYIIGGILVSLPFAVLTLSQYIWVLILYFGCHLLVSYLGWIAGLKDTPI